jgi:hypothetical protein
LDEQGPRRRAAVGLLIILGVLCGGNLLADQSSEYNLLLDDFSDPGGRSAVGTSWEGFTDQVMGGVSTMRSGVEPTDAGPALHMSGEVSLENNGGFIQVRLRLSESGTFDASDYRGLALQVRGRGDHYYLHLRTPRTVFPWAHFAAPIPVSETWRRVEVPFDAFEPQYMLGGRLEPARLKSVAVVAAKAAFEADLWVRSIGLYK